MDSRSPSVTSSICPIRFSVPASTEGLPRCAVAAFSNDCARSARVALTPQPVSDHMESRPRSAAIPLRQRRRSRTVEQFQGASVSPRPSSAMPRSSMALATSARAPIASACASAAVAASRAPFVFARVVGLKSSQHLDAGIIGQRGRQGAQFVQRFAGFLSHPATELLRGEVQPIVDVVGVRDEESPGGFQLLAGDPRRMHLLVPPC